MRRRRLLGLALACLLPAPAWAKSDAPPNGEFYVKLPALAVEFWDENGIFHAVNVDMTAVFPAQATVNKKVVDRIAKTLTSMPWEEFSRGNPAATIKAVALEILRKDPSGATAKEVLIGRLIMR